MPFFDTSLTTTKSLNQGVLGIGIDQGATPPIVTPPSTQVSQSINTTLTPAVTTINNQITTALSSTNNYLRAAIQSTTATFDTAVKSLATGISPSLASIFTNTNNPKSSTTTTNISDPVTTNLINNKTPGAGTFNINSLQTGSSPLTGSTSIFGSGAGSMQGSVLSTLLNRFNLDLSSATNLPQAVVTNTNASKVNGLFATLSVDAGSIAGSLVGSITTDPQLGGLAAGLTTGFTASQLGVSSSPIVTRALTNDLSVFLGTTKPLTTALGNPQNSNALANYFTANPSYSLTNSVTGTPIATNGSGVDVTVANAILGVAQKSGCQVTTPTYGSANQQASSFNLSLELAAINAMADLVGSLLGCSHASTAIGQASIGSAFVASSQTQIGMAATLLQSVQSPALLNTPTTTTNILTNPNLTANDVGTVNSIFTTLGTTTQDAYTLADSSTPQYPVYDISLLSQTQPSFLDATFNSSDFTNYLNGTPMTVAGDGSLGTLI